MEAVAWAAVAEEYSLTTEAVAELYSVAASRLAESVEAAVSVKAEADDEAVALGVQYDGRSDNDSEARSGWQQSSKKVVSCLSRQSRAVYRA